MGLTHHNVLVALRTGITLTASRPQMVRTIRIYATMRSHGPCVFDEGRLGSLVCASAGAEGAEPLAECRNNAVAGKQTAEGR